MTVTTSQCPAPGHLPLLTPFDFKATNITVSAGTNVLTAVYHGPAFTNAQMVATNTSTVVVVNPTFGYDAKGNLTNDAEFVCQYDIANRLTNVISKASGSSVLAARYDGLGRRVEVTRDGSTVERYVYFPGSFLVLAVLNGSNQIKEIYTHGPDLSGVVGGAGGIGGILSVSTNIGAASAVKYIHADAMGNVILVSDSAGEQVASCGFTPFGKVVNQVGDYHARFLFSSKELDPETGLVLYGVRYLNPDAGTWLTRDIIAEMDGPNLYAFVGNSPLALFDAYGMASELAGYDYSVYLGIGPAAGNSVIQQASQIAAQYKAEYTPPKDASKKCKFTIEDHISSKALRAATTAYDDVHFYGHGVKYGTRNPKWKRGDPASELHIYRTAIMFADGNKFLSDVLTADSSQIKAGVVVTWICHDKFVDTGNPSGIPVCRPMNSEGPNQSFMLMRTMREIMAKCRRE